MWPNPQFPGKLDFLCTALWKECSENFSKLTEKHWWGETSMFPREFCEFYQRDILQNTSGWPILVIFKFFVVLSFSCFTKVFRVLVNTILFISGLFLNNFLYPKNPNKELKDLISLIYNEKEQQENRG